MSITLLLGVALLAQDQEPTAKRYFPEPPFVIDAPVYPGGTDVECAIGVSLAGFLAKDETEPFDPVLRDDGRGDVDCENAFVSAGIRIKHFDGSGPHLVITRPLKVSDGSAVLQEDFQDGMSFRWCSEYVMEMKNETWIVTDKIGGYIT